jgi:hypothetical protein
MMMRMGANPNDRAHGLPTPWANACQGDAFSQGWERLTP